MKELHNGQVNREEMLLKEIRADVRGRAVTKTRMKNSIQNGICVVCGGCLVLFNELNLACLFSFC